MFSAAAMLRQSSDCSAGKTQYSQNFSHEVYAATGGGNVTLTAQGLIDLTAARIPAGEISYLTNCGEESRVVEATDFLVKIDINLDHIGSGFGSLGDGTVTSSANCVVKRTDGGLNNMQAGGSETIGPIVNNGFYKPINLESIEIAEGSAVTLSYIIASPLV